MFPVVIGVCEDDLRRDHTFLKSFGGVGADLRINPIHGGTLDSGVARLVERQVASAAKAGLTPAAVLVHHDVDRQSVESARSKVRKWFESKLSATSLPLVVCAPRPCLERWLCRTEGSDKRVRSASPAAGCDPWKKAWERGTGNDLDRVRDAAARARGTLTGLEDFELFLADWWAAGLP
jgi:hypothetical protein